MAFKTWSIGDVLTSSDMNNYIGQQVVAIYSSSAVRATGIPSPVNGQSSYLTDKDHIETYDGSQWQPLPSAMWVFSAAGPSTAIAAGASALVTITLPTGRFTTAPILAGLTTTGAYVTPVVNATSTTSVTVALMNNGAASQPLSTVTITGVAIMMATGTATG
jgi:hypothetical protein